MGKVEGAREKMGKATEGEPRATQAIRTHYTALRGKGDITVPARTGERRVRERAKG